MDFGYRNRTDRWAGHIIKAVKDDIEKIIVLNKSDRINESDGDQR